MSAQWIGVGIGAFGNSIESEVTDGDNMVSVGGGDATGTESRAVIGEIACVSLRSQREILMVAGRRFSLNVSCWGKGVPGFSAETNCKTKYQGE